MKSNQDWKQVTLVGALALASLFSIALSAPHRDRTVVYAAPVAPDKYQCSEGSQERFRQFLAVIGWTEKGIATMTLPVCRADDPTEVREYSAPADPQRLPLLTP